MMGLRSSPFTCTHTFGWSEGVILGDHLDPDITLGCDKVVFNLPEYTLYKPTKPWVYHFNSVTGHMATLFTTYIDGIITGSHIKKSCQDTSLQMASGVNYLGQ